MLSSELLLAMMLTRSEKMCFISELSLISSKCTRGEFNPMIVMKGVMMKTVFQKTQRLFKNKILVRWCASTPTVP